MTHCWFLFYVPPLLIKFVDIRALSWWCHPTYIDQTAVLKGNSTLCISMAELLTVNSRYKNNLRGLCYLNKVHCALSTFMRAVQCTMHCRWTPGNVRCHEFADFASKLLNFVDSRPKVLETEGSQDRDFVRPKIQKSKGSQYQSFMRPKVCETEINPHLRLVLVGIYIQCTAV